LFDELISEDKVAGNLNVAERPQSFSSKCPLRITKASVICFLVENETTSELAMLSLVSTRRQPSMQTKCVRLFMRYRIFPEREPVVSVRYLDRRYAGDPLTLTVGLKGTLSVFIFGSQ
jgi:hypothetical protein